MADKGKTTGIVAGIVAVFASLACVFWGARWLWIYLAGKRTNIVAGLYTAHAVLGYCFGDLTGAQAVDRVLLGTGVVTGRAALANVHKTILGVPEKVEEKEAEKIVPLVAPPVPAPATPIK